MFVFILAIILTAADQAAKILTVKFLMPEGSVELINGVLSLTYVENRGAAFGMLQNARWFFITVTLAAICAIIYYTVKHKPSSRLLKTALALILAGAVGNIIDRIFRGFVVDMIEITFIDYPVFNLADCCVVIGAVLYAIYVLFIFKEPRGEMKNQ